MANYKEIETYLEDLNKKKNKVDTLDGVRKEIVDATKEDGMIVLALERNNIKFDIPSIDLLNIIDSDKIKANKDLDDVLKKITIK